jgi:hypothetical protein
MNRSGFQDAIDRLGEDLATWPLPDRQAALHLLAREPDLRACLDDASRLRAALLDQAPIRAPAGLADRIVKAALGSKPAGATGPRRA